MTAPIVVPTDSFSCAICKTEKPWFRWTDTHGIAACQVCGTPYRIYHYEEIDGKQRRVDKPAECQIDPSWVLLLARYWNEKHSNVDPGGFNFPGSSYEVATRQEFTSYAEWMEKHKEEWPRDESST